MPRRRPAPIPPAAASPTTRRSLPALPEPVRFNPSDLAVDPIEERRHLLTLRYAQASPHKLPPATLIHTLRTLGSATAILSRDVATLADVMALPETDIEAFLRSAGSSDVTVEVAAECRRLDDGPDRVLSPLDAEYPALLRLAPEPPLALWVRGQLLPQDAVAVAVLGASRCTPRAAEIAGQHAAYLAQHGVTVVNGGEHGVDAAALEAALEHGGRAVVAMGAGLFAHQRPKLQRLYDRIARHHPHGPHEADGALLSTFPLHTPPDVVNQVAGDHLVTRLTLATLVVRAHRNGGALIAARFAHEADRPVLAVPGDPDADDVQGCHQLLTAGRARLALQPDDTIDAAKHTVQRITQQHAQRRWLQPNITAEHPLGPADRADRELLYALQRNAVPTPAGQLLQQLDHPNEPEHRLDVQRRLTRLRLMGLIQFDATSQRYTLPGT